jgi:hypothetical protein
MGLIKKRKEKESENNAGRKRENIFRNAKLSEMNAKVRKFCKLCDHFF